jgi:hypothetical protein
MIAPGSCICARGTEAAISAATLSPAINDAGYAWNGYLQGAVARGVCLGPSNIAAQSHRLRTGGFGKVASNVLFRAGADSDEQLVPFVMPA